MPVILVASGVFTVLILLIFAISGPSTVNAQKRRIGSLRARHGGGTSTVEAQMRKITSNRPLPSASGKNSIIPNRAVLAQRLAMTGKQISADKYLMVCGGLIVLVAAPLLIKGAPILLAIFVSLAVGLFLPHMVIGRMIKKRVNDFTVRFPDAIELMVRGLRTGLPISETLTIVSTEIGGSISAEFKMVVDKIKIGRTMDEALQEAADRLGTAEFKFFCITLAIQRETGGNLAETLSNLSEVLRKRAQMKLKIRAMSSESKASAYIVGSLPFMVTTMIALIAPEYIGGFLTDERLMVAGLGGAVWMGIGVFIMAKMVSFEI